MRLILLASFLFFSCLAMAQDLYLFIGTYTAGGSKGMYVYRFNTATGRAEWVSNTEGLVNPSYLALAQDRKHVYAVTESATKNAGSVSAFSFDEASGQLKFLNKQSSGGDNPCYVAVSKDSKWVTVGNYTAGSLSVYPVNTDGSLQPPVQNIQHTGRSIVDKRQDAPHVHATVFSPAEDFLFVPDLGLDKIMIYQFQPGTKEPLKPANPSHMASVPGSGPRHFTFHPNNKYAYVIEELSGTVVAYRYSNGNLKMVQRVATHPSDFKGVIGSADIHISPDGKFLYASNRGDQNDIAIFSINTRTGRLVLKGFQPTLGKTPRNFVIDPTGKYLLAANQDTNNIVVFERSHKTGLLRETGEQIKVPTPVCLKFMK